MNHTYDSLVLGGLVLLVAAANAQVGAAAFANPHAPLEKRVSDLVSRMTLEEKASQLQHETPAITRLQVPAYRWWNESLHGVSREGYMTVFPQAIALAATLDKGLLREVGETISVEARARNNDAIRPESHHHTAASMLASTSGHRT